LPDGRRGVAKREKGPGIFCVEGDWSSDLADRASVLDMLDMLETVDGIPYIHEHVGDSIDAFEGALRKWRLKKYSDYSIAYFAFHGKPGKLMFGRHVVPLKQIAAVLKGACAGRILYFGSCSVLRIEEEVALQFLAETGADAVVGFTRDVSWLASAALDLILLEALAVNTDEVKVEKWLRKEYGALARHLGLRMYYGDKLPST
jgi:hypothetical protein